MELTKYEQLELELDMLLEEIEDINVEIYENHKAIERIETEIKYFE